MSSSRLGLLLRAVFAVIVFMAAFGACASPTLPLPPPAIPSIAPAGEGKVTLRSEHGVEPNAVVIIINHNESLPPNLRVDGTWADVNGTWEETIFASPGDIIDVSQEFGTMRSAQTTFQIPNR